MENVYINQLCCSLTGVFFWMAFFSSGWQIFIQSSGLPPLAQLQMEDDGNSIKPARAVYFTAMQWKGLIAPTGLTVNVRIIKN